MPTRNIAKTLGGQGGGLFRFGTLLGLGVFSVTEGNADLGALEKDWKSSGKSGGAWGVAASVGKPVEWG